MGMNDRRQPKRQLIGVGELARALGVAPGRIHKWRAEGRALPTSFRVGGRLRFDLEEVDQWIEGLRDNAHRVTGSSRRAR